MEIKKYKNGNIKMDGHKLKFGDYYTAEVSFFKNNFPHMAIVRVSSPSVPLFEMLTYDKRMDAVNPNDLYYFKLCEPIDMEYKGPSSKELAEQIEEKGCE